MNRAAITISLAAAFAAGFDEAMAPQAETWIASAFAKASADKSLRSQ